MKWCCSAFEGHFENAGKRGMSVFIDATGVQPRFILQFRAAEGQMDLNTSEPVSLLIDVIITFCPWCGERLDKQYQNDTEKLARNDLRIPL